MPRILNAQRKLRHLQMWLEAAAPRLHHNVLAVALANKLARIAWSVLTREGGYTRTPGARPA